MFLRRLIVVVPAAVAVVVAGCQSGGGGTTTTPAATTPPAATTTAPATAATRQECAQLLTTGQALATTVGQLLQGNASVDQVRAAAGQLSSAINSAQQSVGTDMTARLNDAKAALQRVLDAAGAQPPDTAAMRAGVNDLLTGLRAAADSCQAPATPTTGG